MLNQMTFVTCDCVVTLHGVTLSPLALVMEFMPLGPLDKYLREHQGTLKEVMYGGSSSGGGGGGLKLYWYGMLVLLKL